MSRDPNLDLFRASAIVLVLIHHLVQFSTGFPPWVHDFSRLGIYGVDLFFVLSGWLIGRLYWREKEKFGHVEIRRFLFRRWLRTIPPYLVVLPVAWLAVFIYRGQTFDWKFLLFLQNYMTEIPFFLISWSLCVEEQFYLALPFLLGLLVVLRIPIVGALLTFAFVSFLLRIIDGSANPVEPFGYAFTATHLRLEGLAFGVIMAYASVFDTALWSRIKFFARKLLPFALLVFLSMAMWGTSLQFYIGSSLVPVIWAIVLAAGAGSKPVKIAKTRAVLLMAMWSYSIYLSHSLVIHGARRLLGQWVEVDLIYFLVSTCLILIVGWVLFFTVERSSILMRDRLVPRRVAVV
jgi:peptidoglycan/LPS O-acetylase OafA/YrhL